MSGTREPFTLQFRGQALTLTDEEANAIRKTLTDQAIARTQAEHAAARAAGQVWTAIYWRYHSKYEEECFSLEEATSYLDSGEEYGNLSSDSIRCPDGSIHTREDLGGVDWSNLLTRELEDAS